MEIQLVRHATLLVTTVAGKILVDPIFGDAGVMPPIDNSANDRRNPLVNLPVSVAELNNVAAVLLTHTHRDHFDSAAAAGLPKDIIVFCQPEDEQKLRDYGFTIIRPIDNVMEWNGLRIIRTGGEHGTGEIGKLMGPVSGYILEQQGEPTLYITGDTVWCQAVEQAIKRYQPQVIVAFAGAAQFVGSDPITMSAEDVTRVCRQAPLAKVVAVHLEAFNHCLLTRQELTKSLLREGLDKQVAIPLDGEVLIFAPMN